MPVTDLGDWLDEQMEYALEPLLQDADAEYGALWYIKRLSATDTGAGRSHQAGVYVPRQVIFKVIPGLEEMDANSPGQEFNLVVDSHDYTRHAAKAIWYWSKMEARVTGLAGSALQDRQSAGNLTVFAFHLATLEEPLRCRVWVCHDADEEALLQERVGFVRRWRVWPDFNEEQNAEIAAFAQRTVGTDADETAAIKRGIIRAVHSAHNKAVELRAMAEAMRHYREAGWEVEDISLQKLGYDIRCSRDDAELHVEVKGVSSDGSEVNLTRNEVIHAREYRASALFVLSHIEVTYDDTGRPVANGGQARIFDPWRVDDDGELTATTYSYRLQPG